jgi:uncharacterized protein YxjI
MDRSRLQEHKLFRIKQDLTVMVNRYEVTREGGDGGDADVVAYAEQNWGSFKEQVTFFTDRTKSQVLFTFKARSVLDVAGTYDVLDEAGKPIGTFNKKFAASLLRSTWKVTQDGAPPLTGRERSVFVALLRRVWGAVPLVELLPFAWPYHFDFSSDGGERAMRVDKNFGMRDSYVLDIESSAVDRRLAIAQAVALDALQER